MIIPTMTVMIIALIPIVLLEAFCFYNFLEVSFWRAFKSALLANIFSTFIGIPVTWIGWIFLIFRTHRGRLLDVRSRSLFVKIVMFIWESAWIHPRGKRYRLLTYASGLVLIVPFFFASWFSEYWIAAYFLADPASTGEINKAVRNANLLSYVLLALYGLALLIREQRYLRNVMSNKSLDVRRNQRASAEILSETSRFS